MKRRIISIAVVIAVVLPCWAQDDAGTSAKSESNDLAASIRGRLESYMDAYNEHDAAALGSYWAADGVSVAEETGERTEGRDVLQEEYGAFFQKNPSARLTGEATVIRVIRPDVVLVEGRTSLFVADEEPIQSAFSAILVQEGDQWLISSSHERDLPAPATPYEALKELEWLVGTWEDQAEGAQVTTTVRWSPNQAFLIRSFSGQFVGDESLQGTQVIGWDPLSRQIRTWTFNSDGSFGQGTVSKHDDDLMLKMWQVLGDGRVASGTKVMTRVDDDTITVQTIGETVDGEPAPTLEPVTVVRVSEAAVSTIDANEGENE